MPVLDEYGRVFARIDMGWAEWLVGVDFDGAHHWTDSRQRTWDVERYARLAELGWIDVRLTSGMLHHNPHAFIDRVGSALTSRGCPKTW
jgi:very-short-patch-repair endonuclease